MQTGKLSPIRPKAMPQQAPGLYSKLHKSVVLLQRNLSDLEISALESLLMLQGQDQYVQLERCSLKITSENMRQLLAQPEGNRWGTAARSRLDRRKP